MKKIFALTLILLFAATSVIATAASYYYPPYMNGDKNFPLVYARQGIADYIDKTSIRVKVYDPPFYIISARIIYVSNAEISEELANNEDYIEYKKKSKVTFDDKEKEFFYDEEMRDMRFRDDSTHQWMYLRPDRNLYVFANQRTIHYGEALFYITQKRKFYGGYLAKNLTLFSIFNGTKDYDRSTLDYSEIFPDSFYENLDE